MSPSPFGTFPKNHPIWDIYPSLVTNFHQVDVDGSGFLEFPEFCLMMYKKLSDTDVV